MSDATTTRRPAAAWAVAGLLLVLFVLLLAVSWRRWCDPLMDFGHDLYVAWRVSEGDVLNRDVAHFNGPFSPYFNALAMRLCGPHVLTLCLLNVAIAAALAGLLFTLLRRIADLLAATLGAAAFLVMFAFAHLLPTGDYNFITPYSHEATHGTLFSLLALWLLARSRETGSGALAALGGAAIGIVLLTKAEIALAAVLAVMAFAWTAHRCPPLRPGRGRLAPVLFGLAFLLLAAFALLASSSSPREALLGMLGSWRYLARPGLLTLPNFASSLGHRGAGASLAGAGVWATLWGLVFLLLLASALRTPRTSAGRRLVVACCGLLPLTLIAASATRMPWLGAFRPLPFALLALLAWQLRRLHRGLADARVAPLTLAFLVLALAQLARMAANVTICHYGFVLALPGTLVLFAALLSWLPTSLSAAGHHGAAFRAGAAGLVVGLVAVHFAISLRQYANKNSPLGRGADTVLVADKGPLLAATLAEIERRVEPGGTFLALPGGALLNVLSHRASPIPFVSLFPPEFAIFGEEAILSSLRRRPPSLAVLFTRSTVEYGFPRIGVGYGERVMAWFAPRYSAVGLIGGDPRAGQRFGALLLAPVGEPREAPLP